MDAKSKNFLRRLLDTATPSGYEQAGQAVVGSYLKEFADKIDIDVHGNLHAVCNPKAPFRVMFSGHVDEIGLMVMHIDDKGFLYATAVGGVHVPGLQGERVVVHAAGGPVPGVIGVKPIHLMDEKERSAAQGKIHEMWIDIGAPDKKTAQKLVALGDVATIDKPVLELPGGKLVARGLDDRIGVFVVAEALRLCSKDKLSVALHVVSTVQEEIGLRGATTSAYAIDPHIGVAVDVGFATDFPGADPKRVGEAKLGGGPILHRGANFNPAVLRLLEKAAKDAKVPTQMQPIARGSGTDANAMQLTRGGVAAGLVSIPNRYMHSPVEMVDLADVENSAKLLARFARNLKGTEKLRP